MYPYFSLIVLKPALIHFISGRSNHFGHLPPSQEKSFNNSPMLSGFLFDWL